MFFKSKKEDLSKAALEAQDKLGEPGVDTTLTTTRRADKTIPPLDASTSASASNDHKKTVASQPNPEPDKSAQLSPEELRRRAAQSKRTAASFGEIVSVFMRSKEFKGLTLGQLEQLVVPAVVTGQFLIAEAQSKKNGMTAPVAAVLWATVSEELDKRLTNDLDKPVTLTSKDWRSGDIPWLIGVAGDRRLVGGMLKKLQLEVFRDRPIKLRSRGGNGQTTVATVAVGSTPVGGELSA